MAAASAFVTAIQLFVSVYVTPGGRVTPATGHQVESLLSPPILSTGCWPGVRLRINRSNTGSTAAGLVPAYASTAGYSSERPRNPVGITAPLANALAGGTAATADGGLSVVPSPVANASTITSKATAPTTTRSARKKRLRAGARMTRR